MGESDEAIDLGPDEELNPDEELLELVRAFRLHLAWQRRAGAHAVSAARMPAALDASPSGPGLAGDDAEAVHEPWADAHAAAEHAPRADAHAAADPLARPLPPGGSFVAALDQALGEEAPRPARTPQRHDARPTRADAPLPAHERAHDAEPRARRLSLTEVRAELGACQRCKLSRGRNNIVFGSGDPDAALMFIGEAPGSQEDREGLPFVGQSGELLDLMIKAMGWTRETVYIANVVKCRPPGNRDPEPDEIAACKPFLVKQIATIRPRIIVTLGRASAQLLLATDAPMHALRGQFRAYQGIKVMPTFHPAYLLRHEEHKRATWNDLKLVIAELERLGVRPPLVPRA